MLPSASQQHQALRASRPWLAARHTSRAAHTRASSSSSSSSSRNVMSKRSIVWFRKGLRLHDNPALLEGCKDAQHLYPIFIIDPHFLKQGSGYRVGVNRYNFLLESLADLDKGLRARGSRLMVLRGTPGEVLPRVLKDWGITHLCYEVDTEPYAKIRDAAARDAAEAAGAEVCACVSHTLYDTEALVAKNGGKAPLTMQAFTKLVDKVGEPLPPAADPPATLPGPAPGAKGTEEEATTVPTLQECGYSSPPTTPFRGGEVEALRRFEEYMKDTKWVASFQKPDTDPSAWDKPATTVLSPYLKFGCLSPRLFHQRLLQVYAQHKAHSQPPVSLRGQLLWREFFYTVGSHTPNFNRMEGNPICRQIDWDHDEERLAAWAEGRTGYPWIDAIMTQLREWGWIHHLARHSVACFLTRGDLYLSWEQGQEVFEELLLDQDHFLNAANWQWLSASAFFNSYFRVYSPVAFGKKYDKDGKYVRRFLPILKDMPSKYIYEPWLAPVEVQRKAGCIVGVDYPRPIVDHATASKQCIARIGAAYKAGKAAAGAGGKEEEDEEEEVEEHAKGKKLAGGAKGKAAKGAEGEASGLAGSKRGAAAGASPRGKAGATAGAGKGRKGAASKATEGAEGDGDGGTAGLAEAEVGGEGGPAEVVVKGPKAKRQRTLAEAGMTKKGTKRSGVQG